MSDSLSYRKTSQADRIQTLRVTQDLYDKVAVYADDNSLSISEALREILGAYANGDVMPPHRQRRTRRVSFWIDPADWVEFRKRAERDKVSIADAAEAAIKEAV